METSTSVSNMDVVIDGQIFTFDNASTVRIEDRYDLYIEEPGFDKGTEEKIGHFTSKRIELPDHIERRVTRTGEIPCSKVFKDVNGKKRLYTYFD